MRNANSIRLEIEQLESELEELDTLNKGAKIQVNGTFGKTGSIYSVLFAPKMMVQTTLTGQLALLMLIERYHLAGIAVVSANTDGIVLKYRPAQEQLAAEIRHGWERDTGLTMEANRYSALYSRDVNNYLAVKPNGEVKRKGQYAPTDLIMKKAPAAEICGDACAEYVKNGTPVELTILGCADIRKFVSVKNVAGGAAKLHGDGPTGDEKASDMVPRLIAHGWTKKGARWAHADYPELLKSAEAYALIFEPQRREELSKVIRYYYARNNPGPIVVASGKRSGVLVPETWGAKPCMILPDTLPDDIDYDWYIEKAKKMLRECAALV